MGSATVAPPGGWPVDEENGMIPKHRILAQASALALSLAFTSGALATPRPPEPVPEAEVRSWAEAGSFWCMNPKEAGGCDMLTVWRPSQAGGFEFVAAEVLDATGSLFTITQPFTLEGDRQCYRVDPATVRFGKIGTPPTDALADAHRRWQIGLAQERGDTFCMAFLRDPETGFVRRRQWRNGVVRENPVPEIWRVELQAPAAQDKATPPGKP